MLWKAPCQQCEQLSCDTHSDEAECKECWCSTAFSSIFFLPGPQIVDSASAFRTGLPITGTVGFSSLVRLRVWLLLGHSEVSELIF